MNGQHIEQRGAPLSRAKFAVVLLHGRGGSANDMFGLAEHIGLPDIAYFAPTAPGNSWWPTSFLAPFDEIGPFLTPALAEVDRSVETVIETGFPVGRTLVLGFSQGACLALEYAARGQRSIKAGIAFSGGLLGTSDDEGPASNELYGFGPKRFDYDADLSELSIFIGCHERDPHIPEARVRESETVFRTLGAQVETQIYDGTGHGVVGEELTFVRGLLN